ncbi:hypothetical protein PG997_000568 [Apiospora hydei]|uniref:Uncharacterized protein n=1 Tax=Apiospora hydei TaxID=1337664 RepID=A0ABR1XBB3_9PEZI
MPGPVPQTTPSSPLFLLPSELRHRIWEYYLSFTHADFVDSMRPIHAPLVHHDAVLRIHRPGSRNERRIGFAVHGNLRFERLRRLVLVVELDYPYWNAWLDFFGAVLARAPGLEHLTVDWAPRKTTAAVAGYSFHRAGAWEYRRDEKKEGAFLNMLVGLAGLQNLSFYGRIPELWIKRLQQDTTLSVKCYSYRWWREPGME